MTFLKCSMTNRSHSDHRTFASKLQHTFCVTLVYLQICAIPKHCADQYYLGKCEREVKLFNSAACVGSKRSFASALSNSSSRKVLANIGLSRFRLRRPASGTRSPAQSASQGGKDTNMASMNLLLVYKLQQYQVRVPLDTTFAQLKVTSAREFLSAVESATILLQTDSLSAVAHSQGCSCRKLQPHKQESQLTT